MAVNFNDATFSGALASVGVATPAVAGTPAVLLNGVVVTPAVAAIPATYTGTSATGTAGLTSVTLNGTLPNAGNTITASVSGPSVNGAAAVNLSNVTANYLGYTTSAAGNVEYYFDYTPAGATTPVGFAVSGAALGLQTAAAINNAATSAPSDPTFPANGIVTGTLGTQTGTGTGTTVTDPTGTGTTVTNPTGTGTTVTNPTGTGTTVTNPTGTGTTTSPTGTTVTTPVGTVTTNPTGTTVSTPVGTVTVPVGTTTSPTGTTVTTPVGTVTTGAGGTTVTTPVGTVTVPVGVTTGTGGTTVTTPVGTVTVPVGVGTGSGGTTITTPVGSVTVPVGGVITLPGAGGGSTTIAPSSGGTSTMTSVSPSGATTTQTIPSGSTIAAGTGAAAGDVVSVDPYASYNGSGEFTISGHVAATSGVKTVTISAIVDGAAAPTVLGTATVGTDGAYSFLDQVGAHLQGFITATETDALGATTAVQSPYSLQAGLHEGKFRGEQDLYTADGSDYVSTTMYKEDGSRKVDVNLSGQTFQSYFFDTYNNDGAPENTFVFDPGHGLDVVNLFRANGVDHDTLSFKGSDFNNDIAAVLQNTATVKGGVLITDPVSQDTVKLTGVSKKELAANTADFAFHA